LYELSEQGVMTLFFICNKAVNKPDLISPPLFKERGKGGEGEYI